MKKYGIFAAASFCFFSCSADVDAPIDAKSDINSNITINNYGDINTNKNQPVEASDEIIEDVPSCTAKKEGQLKFIESSEVVIGCYDETWYNIEYDFIADNYESLIKCTEKRSSVISFDIEGNQLYYCIEEKWVKITLDALMTPSSSSSKGSNVFDDDEDDVKSSSSKASAFDDEDDEETGTSSKKSSSSKASSGSDGDIPSIKSSSSKASSTDSEANSQQNLEIPLGYAAKGSMWNGSSLGRVNTGYTDDYESPAGYWWDYGDENSYISWPVSKGNAWADDSYDPIVDYCNGLCGKATLQAGVDFPYVGFAFHISEVGVGVDISSWKGMCFAYVAYGGPTFRVELVPTNDETYTGYNNYKYDFEQTTTRKVVDLDWSDFFQDEGWGNIVPLDEFLARVTDLHFSIRGTADDVGKSEVFNLLAIGKKGTCY